MYDPTFSPYPFFSREKAWNGNRNDNNSDEKTFYIIPTFSLGLTSVQKIVIDLKFPAVLIVVSIKIFNWMADLKTRRKDFY